MRLFLAITLPDELQAAIARALAPAREAAPAVRWVRDGLLHLTIKFLGERPEREVAPIAAAARTALAGVAPFDVTVGKTGAFPNFRSPRVVWLDMYPAAPLAAVARRLDAALAPLGLAPEARPFRAHVTLGRVAGIPSDQRRALERTLRAVHGSWPLAVRDVRLMQSTLGRGGPVYEVLDRLALEGR